MSSRQGEILGGGAGAPMGTVRGTDLKLRGATKFVVEIPDGLPKALSQLHLRGPSKRGPGLCDVRPSPARIVDWQRLVDHLRAAADDVDDDVGKLPDGRLDRVSEIHRAKRTITIGHQPRKPVDQVADEAERTRLLAGAVDGDVLAEQRLDHEV